ncbi:MAG: hypothetical protein ABR865_12265 [Terracidiphilus sp.]|jgi:hypothetical protein
MRVLWATMVVLTATQGASSAHSEPPMPAGQLVGEVVYNELNDHSRHGYWRYWVERRSQTGTRLEDQVETSEGPVARLALSNGRALTPEAEQQEQERLERLLSSRDEQADQLRQYDEDEERIGRILALLPTAFVYEYDGEENGCYRLRFRPNPADKARSIEERIFHSMSGTLWVDARTKRLAKLEGHVDENVEFGFGILGKLYKGGWFRLVREQVSATDWKTESLEVHMNIRALLVKTFARETNEVRGGFVAVPAGMSLEQGLALLNKNKAGIEGESGSQQRQDSGNGLLASTESTLHR